MSMAAMHAATLCSGCPLPILVQLTMRLQSTADYPLQQKPCVPR